MSFAESLDRLLRFVTGLLEDPSRHVVFLNPGTRARDVANCAWTLRETQQPFLLTRGLPEGADPATFCTYLPAEILADDLGHYFFIPKLALGLGIPTYVVQNLFYGSLIAVGIAVALVGWWKVFSNPRARWIATATTVLAAIQALYTFDVYTPSFLMACFVPGMIHVRDRWESTKGRDLSVWVAVAAFGLLAGISETIRGLSSAGVAIFGLLLLSRSFRIPTLRTR